MTFKLLGYDTFEGGDAWYPIGAFDTEAAARAAAAERLKELERTQPSATSGGQDSEGIQDRVYIEHPDGRKERVR